jgi:hypothetical protein
MVVGLCPAGIEAISLSGSHLFGFRSLICASSLLHCDKDAAINTDEVYFGGSDRSKCPEPALDRAFKPLTTLSPFGDQQQSSAIHSAPDASFPGRR